MAVPSAVSPITIEEYLSNPAYEHCEYIDGQAVEINVGSIPHSKIQAKCTQQLVDYLKGRPGGYAAVELRCRLSVAGRTRFYLPDVSVVLAAAASSETRFLEGAPDLVVEIRSPDDSLTALIRKMDDYFANGAKLAWLILPEERSVLIFTPNAATRTALPGEIVDGGDLLAGLQIRVDELFSE